LRLHLATSLSPGFSFIRSHQLTGDLRIDILFLDVLALDEGAELWVNVPAQRTDLEVDQIFFFVNYI
jgi:hypothetical protein